ncbi:hypothetical protein B484DRAFT_408090 [Ochromonadaceae sp. CCMP2298]|nr:hypothetical protein B484DRAFT_408090 [Ochromonadaceae sp. CCMP2298]
MLDQLEELGVGKNLRELLVRIYGGHIWQVDVALDRLASEFKAGDETSVVRGPMDSIEDAFALWEEKKGDRERLVGVLEEVARCGFYPLHKYDALARVLTKSNACTFLSHDTKEFFVDPKRAMQQAAPAAAAAAPPVITPAPARTSTGADIAKLLDKTEVAEQIKRRAPALGEAGAGAVEKQDKKITRYLLQIEQLQGSSEEEEDNEE